MQRILLTNNHLVQPGGSETWTLTVSRELVRRGHEVYVYAREIGPLAKAFPCPVVRNVPGEFDVGLVNHNSCLKAARPACGTVVMTCHGTHPELEQPVPGADRYVAISEEVQAHLRCLGFDSTLIRNPIDCSLFAPRRRPEKRLRRVLSLCQGQAANDLLEAVCRREGWRLRTVDDGHRRLGVEKLMNAADLVVGLGRSAMEGMACGRPVLVMDSRSYTAYAMDGRVTPDNVWPLLECNLSGRRFKLPVTEDEVAAQLAAYDRGLGDFCRLFTLENFRAERQVDEYLRLASSAAVPQEEPAARRATASSA
jgi:glycosyltransferase involved in cell wall biosynthesis